jgi:hypothetical protein
VQAHGQAGLLGKLAQGGRSEGVILAFPRYRGPGGAGAVHGIHPASGEHHQAPEEAAVVATHQEHLEGRRLATENDHAGRRIR